MGLFDKPKSWSEMLEDISKVEIKFTEDKPKENLFFKAVKKAMKEEIVHGDRPDKH